MNWDDMNEAVENARGTLRLADSFATQMARMLAGRLRKVNTHVLCNLKKELRDFNMHTGLWKNLGD